MIHPEVQGALIGIGAMSVVHLGKIGFDYLKLKLGKNGKHKNGYCEEHYRLLEVLHKLEEHYNEEKQIGLYEKAIIRANNK